MTRTRPFAVLASMLAASTAALAQTPQGTAFTYQGRLHTAGSPASGLHDLELRLFDAASAGTQVGPTVCINDVPVVDGLFTVQVDFGGQYMGTGRWLQIGVREDLDGSIACGSGTFTPLSGRQALTATPYALALPGLWTQNNATSPNVIGGFRGNFVGPGVIGAVVGGGGLSDYPNAVTSGYGVVAGGASNTASAVTAVVSGGYTNTASGNYSFVGGGQGNVASGIWSTTGGGYYNVSNGGWSAVAGGNLNTASGSWAAIAGGSGNAAGGNLASIGGGAGNTAGAEYSTVAGGFANTAGGYGSSIVGGRGNLASVDYSTAAGGYFNTAGGTYSFAAGQHATVRTPAQSGDSDGDQGTFVWADASTGSDFTSTGPNQFLIRAAGGVGIGTASPSKPLEVATSTDCEIGINSMTTNGRLWTLQSSSGTATGQLAASFQIIDRTAGACRILIDTTGRVGIGTSSPDQTLSVNGNASKPGGGSWAAFCDPRLKHDIHPMSGTLDRLLSLRGYSFEYNADAVASGKGLPGRQLGLMADEVERVFPDWISRNDEGYRAVTERATTALMVESLRDLRAEKDAEIAKLRAEKEAEIAALRAEQAAQIRSLNDRLARLEAMLVDKAPARRAE